MIWIFLRSFCVLFFVSLVGGSFRIEFLVKSKVFLSGVSLVWERNHSSGRKLLSKFHFFCETFTNISFVQKFCKRKRSKNRQLINVFEGIPIN